MTSAGERERLLNAKAQVRSLRTEVEQLEALVAEPQSAASVHAVARKVTKVCASNVATTKVLLQQPKSARVVAGTDQPIAQHFARPAPPPRQRSIGTGPADDDAIFGSHAQQLVSEGYSNDAALAAVQAVEGGSLMKAREWLKTHQCGSGAKTARVLRTQQRDQENATQTPSLSFGAPSYRPSAPSFARAVSEKAVITEPQVPLQQNLVAGAPRPAPPTTFQTTSNQPLSVCDNNEAASVCVKVRNLLGEVIEVKKLFRPSDSLLTVLTQFLQEHPLQQGPSRLSPPPTSSHLQLVVPLERKTYSYDEMRVTTLVVAKLVPRATVVLQIKK
jgi:hypothetical protein